MDSTSTSGGGVTSLKTIPMSYISVHLYITLPVLLTLWLIGRPFIHILDRIKLFFLIVVAIAYTTPWDSWIIQQGAWTYCNTCVLGTLWAIPYEEYMFFVIQTITSGVFGCLVFHFQSSPVKSIAEVAILSKQSQLGNSPTSPTKLGIDPDSPLGRKYRFEKSHVRLTSFQIKRNGAILILSGLLMGFYCLYQGREYFYFGAILTWTCPVILLQWLAAGPLITYHGRRAIISIVIPTLYLCLVDWYALQQGAWNISATTSVSWKIMTHLPVEEALFFFLTNVMLGTCVLI
jgi:15-cis-phytoene synthase/lycopene beta-cyclase